MCSPRAASLKNVSASAASAASKMPMRASSSSPLDASVARQIRGWNVGNMPLRLLFAIASLVGDGNAGMRAHLVARECTDRKMPNRSAAPKIATLRFMMRRERKVPVEARKYPAERQHRVDTDGRGCAQLSGNSCLSLSHLADVNPNRVARTNLRTVRRPVRVWSDKWRGPIRTVVGPSYSGDKVAALGDAFKH